MARIEILSHEDDGRAHQIEDALRRKSIRAKVRVVDVYTTEKSDAPADFVKSLINPVTQSLLSSPPPLSSPRKRGSGDGNEKIPDQVGEYIANIEFDWALEIGYLPGVTDNVGHTASELLGLSFNNQHPDESQDPEATKTWIPDQVRDAKVFSSKMYLIKGDAQKEDIESLAHELSNKLIQRASIKSREEFTNDNGMDVVIPKVTLDNKGAAADDVDLSVSDEELTAIGKEGIAGPDGVRRGPLGMPLLYMQAVRDYFEKEGRPAKDIELETIAQTWSEHCKHTIFASPIDDIKDGIYKHYIKRATQEIRKKRGKDDICVSVFSDNAGGIIFDENYLITDKVETHNSPSALDPFGGAITGIVGVNRDCVGFGKGAKPVINRYGFCFADPRKDLKYYRDPAQTNATLSPEAIMKGVIHGVNVGGNCSGIPTPQGFAYFDDRYVGKPLVFVGTIGLIPREINGKPGHEKKAQPGDNIVIVGGRVGRDGIHGATFSSVALDEGSPATAVQIGDPITQKKFSDAIVKEIRDRGWYSAITDNGAGGMSSSIGEMAEQSGGFHVELDKVPLKYPGMAPWEIWISESQERMTLSVPPENTDKLIAHLAKRGVEATVVGTYTDTGRAQITWHGETIMDMAMDFLHDGLPETPLKTSTPKFEGKEPDLVEPADYAKTLEAMLSRLNICSKEFIATQYDHNVQGSAVLGPIQGPGRVYADTTITKPVLTSPKGVVLSQGLAPRYSDIDTYHMAANALDVAVRNAVAAGVDYRQLAILDNFCWCSSDEAERLGQLKLSAEAIYNFSTLYQTPFISGKDSMFNDFKGYDENGEPVKISVPPTLLVSSIGVIPDVSQSISLTPKAAGDLVYLLGQTKDELGASEYYDEMGELGANVPEVDGPLNDTLYQLYSAAARENLIASALSIGFGGLGVALAKKAIAGQLGMDIDLSPLCHPEMLALKDLDSSAPALQNDKNKLRADKAFFSESAGRILVTVRPEQKEAFEKAFADFDHVQQIGHITNGNKLNINNILECEIKVLNKAYKAPLKGY